MGGQTCCTSRDRDKSINEIAQMRQLPNFKSGINENPEIPAPPSGEYKCYFDGTDKPTTKEYILNFQKDGSITGKVKDLNGKFVNIIGAYNLNNKEIAFGEKFGDYEVEIHGEMILTPGEVVTIQAHYKTSDNASGHCHFDSKS